MNDQSATGATDNSTEIAGEATIESVQTDLRPERSDDLASFGPDAEISEDISIDAISIPGRVYRIEPDESTSGAAEQQP
jgi:hypothetical protein